MGPRSAASALILLAAFLFSTGGAAIKATALTGWQVASFRSGVAALALLALLSRAGRSRPRFTRSTIPAAVVYALPLITFVMANKLTTAASTIFLQSMAPFYLVLLGPLCLGERLRRSDILLLAVVLGGFMLFLLDPGRPTTTAPDPARGNLIACLSGVFWALTLLVLRAAGRRDSRAAPAAVIGGNVVACLATLPLALPVHAFAARDLLVILFLGTVQIGLAYVALTAGLRTVPAFQASLLLFLEPALSPLWAFLIHRETPSPGSIAGGIIILAATSFFTLAGRRDGGEAEEPTRSAAGSGPAVEAPCDRSG